MHLPTLARLLLVPLLLLVAVDAGLRNSAWFWSQLGAYRPMTPTWADAQLAQARPPTDVVVLGSSVAYADVDAELLGRLLSGTATLSAVGRATAWHVAMRFPRALDLEPRAVVVVLGMASIGGDADPDAAWTYDPRTAWALVPPARLLADAPWHLDGLLSSGSVLYRYRRVPREVWTQDVLDWGVDPRELPAREGRRLRAHLRLRAVRDRRQLREDGSDNEAALCWMARRGADRGVLTALVVAPDHPSVHTGRGARAEGEAIRRLRGCGLQVVTAETTGTYGARDFVDGIHLGTGARSRFTRALASWLHDRLAG